MLKKLFREMDRSGYPCGQCAMIENGLQKGRTRTELAVDREPSNCGGLAYRLQRETRNPSDLPQQSRRRGQNAIPSRRGRSSSTGTFVDRRTTTGINSMNLEDGLGDVE